LPWVQRTLYLRSAAGDTISNEFSAVMNSNQRMEQAAFLAWMQVTTLAEEHFENCRGE
jgi:hypothetical protein